MMLCAPGAAVKVTEFYEKYSDNALLENTLEAEHVFVSELSLQTYALNFSYFILFPSHIQTEDVTACINRPGCR